MLKDIRYSLRALRASPGFNLVVILVLAIGIGANTSMFTLVDAAFLRPLRFPHSERLVEVYESPQSGGSMPVSYPNFLDWEKQNQSFEAMGIGATFSETRTDTTPPERIRTGYISGRLFDTYGIVPLIGRTLAHSDDTTSAPPVTVLSHAFWQSRFGSDRGILGRKVTVAGQVLTIVGVLPPLDWHRKADVYVPIALALDKYALAMRENHNSTTVTARLKPGATVEQARAQMRTIAKRLETEYPGANGGIEARVAPLRDRISDDMRHSVLLLFAAVGAILLIACANVAGLMLARASVRRREIAIRAALGASRAQLVRQLLIESLLLALAAGGVGVLIAEFTLAALLQIFPGAERLGGAALDGRVLLFSLVVALFTAVLFGLAPALQLTRPDVMDSIKAGGRAIGTGPRRARLRKALVVAQVALAVVLSVGAGLFMRSLLQLLSVQPGFHSEHVMTADIQLPNRKEADVSVASRLLEEVAARVENIPGVQAVGATSSVPMSGAYGYADFYRDDRPLPAPGHFPNAMQAVVTPGYFRALGIPLVRGRFFTPADGRVPPMKPQLEAMIGYIRATPFRVVINEAMARQFWPGEDPVGRTFIFGPPSLKGPQLTIVGVVADSKQIGLERAIEPEFFFSSYQFPIPATTLVIRTSADAASLGAVIRELVAQREPAAVVPKVEALDVIVSRSLVSRKNNAVLLGLFSGIALMLAAIGLYATMAYLVTQRIQEIGIRMAIGAAASDVRRMVVREGALLAVVGVLGGLAGAYAVARVVATMLYGVTAGDVVTYCGAAALLGAVMLLASFIPAWRASRVDPMTALRCD